MEEEIQEEKETLVNKCPNCGAVMEFDIESGNLKCGHCGTVKEINNEEKVARRDISDDIIKEHDKWSENAVYRCNGCGAKQTLDKKDITRICPFCGSTNIVSLEELAGIKPDSVIPFQITKESAVNRFKKWIKSKWLAPKLFKSADLRERLNGIYMSSWSFGATAENTYNGTLGKHVTHTHRNSRGQIYTTTETRWFRVSGFISETYTDYLVQSGERISSAMFKKIQPFNLNLLKVYRQEYLSGIIAEHYSRKMDICFNEFANYIRADIIRKIIRRHNADCAGSLDIKTEYKNRKFNYVLLPIYVANYQYNKKTYNFFVNGASGEVVGKYPKSKWKVAFIVIGALLLTAAAVYFCFLNGNVPGKGDILIA
jgi:DNA-directed RNA polymerase subunit RPC12/RpoP